MSVHEVVGEQTSSGPRILIIGGTYRALSVLERLLERGCRVVAYIGIEGGGERDFCPEILEICDRNQIAARTRTLLIVTILLLVGAAGYLVVRRAGALPGPGSTVYEETVSAFYVGLAALEVGELLDDAENALLRASELIPEEPATWANLGVLHLRRGPGLSVGALSNPALCGDHQGP